MSADNTILHFAPGRSKPSPLVAQFGELDRLTVLSVRRVEDVRALLNRAFPKCLVLETGPKSAEVIELCFSLKQDAFTAMDALERGAIANPDENRMVGRKWPAAASRNRRSTKSGVSRS